MNADQYKSNDRTFTTYMIIFAVGILIGGGVVYRYFNVNYYEIHTSNIGGFIFKNNKVYSLEEIKDL